MALMTKELDALINRLIQDNTASSANLKNIDKSVLRQTLLDFKMLLSFHVDNEEYNIEALNKMLYNAEILVTVSLDKNYKFNKEAKKADRWQDVSVNSNGLCQVLYKNVIEENLNCLYASFSPIRFIPKKSHTQNITVDNEDFKISVKLPLFIKQDIIPDDFNKVDDNTYEVTYEKVFKSNYDSYKNNYNKIKNFKTSIKNKNRILKTLLDHTYKYIKLEDTGSIEIFVLEEWLNNGVFETYAKENYALCSYLAINSKGERLNISDLNSKSIFENIRHSIAHNKNKRTISSTITNKFASHNINAQLILFKDFSLLIPNHLYEKICDIDFDALCQKSDKIRYLYCHTPNEVLDSREKIINYLGSCVNMSLVSNKPLSSKEVTLTVDNIIQEYTKDRKEITRDELIEFISKELPEEFKIHHVYKNGFGINPLIEILENNTWLKKDRRKYSEKVAEYLHFLIVDFYDFKLLNYPSKKHKPTYQISKKGLLKLIDELSSSLKILSTDHRISNIPYELYYNEIYILKCILYGYHNLISNNLVDNLYTSKATYNKNKKKFIRTNISFEYNDVFKHFYCVEKSGNTRRVDTRDDNELVEVLITLRNDIAHFSISIEFADNMKIEDSYLIFEIDDDDSKYFKITCFNFLKFITSKFFEKYPPNTNKPLSPNSFDDLCNLMAKQIKNFKPMVKTNKISQPNIKIPKRK